MYNYNSENQQFRDLLSIYRETHKIIKRKKDKFFKYATHYGVPLKKGIEEFLETEREIVILEKNYLSIEKFIATECSDREKQFLNEIMNGVSLEQVNTELGCSRRTSYRIMARLSKRYFEFLGKEKFYGNCKEKNNTKNNKSR